MVGKRLMSLIFVLVALGTIPVEAQTSSTGESKSILGRIDQFGQNLLGGIFGDEHKAEGQVNAAVEPSQPASRWNDETQLQVGTSRQQQTALQASQRQPGTATEADISMTPRAGSIMNVRPRPSLVTPQAGLPSETSSAQRSAYGTSMETDMQTPTTAGQVSARAGITYRQGSTATSPASQGYVLRQELAGTSNPAQRPLHQRLSTMRDSAFGSPPAEEQAVSQGSAPMTTAQRPSTVQQSATADPPVTRQSEQLVIAQPASVGHGVPTPAIRRPEGEPKVSEPTPARPRPSSLVGSTPAEPRSSSLIGSTPVPDQRQSDAGQQNGMLFTQRSPVLSVETFGPRTISIGKESSYRVQMQNSSDVPAEEMVVFIQLPPWADVLGAEASAGATQLPAAGTNDGSFLWRIGHLGARTSERLTLRLVPRESRPFDLAVRWEYQPVSQQAMIEVQEPKLEMLLDGPREVYFGQRETYKLRLKNTGSGPADNVTITLLPVGTSSNQPVSHRLGTVDAGGEKIVEVELTARQPGNLTVQVEVRGEGGVVADLTEKILVRRAELQLAATGPQMRFVGSEVVYDLRVTNPGNAPAKNIKLSVAVPAGAKYISGIDGGRLEGNETRINWIVPLLEAGSEEAYQVRVGLGLPGTNRLELVATADDALTGSAETLTQVEAMADLAMSVEDPPAPVPVGSDTVYQLRVRNRGTKAAENIEVIAYFSRGIEPVSADGGAHRIGPGQVVFTPIASLAAGGEMVFSIHARAEQPGNHVFRAEMHCKPLDTRLVREETTHFYQDGSVMAGRPAAGSVNTADRRAAAAETVQPD